MLRRFMTLVMLGGIGYVVYKLVAPDVKRYLEISQM